MAEEYKTKKGIVLYSEPGDRTVGDRRLYFEHNGYRWYPTFEEIGAYLRIKGDVEDNRYYRKTNMGRLKVAAFCRDCVMMVSKTIVEICRIHKIPGF